MPTKSKKQLAFMYGVADGSIKAPGLSKDTAKEFVDTTPKDEELPEKVKKIRFKKLFP